MGKKKIMSLVKETFVLEKIADKNDLILAKCRENKLLLASVLPNRFYIDKYVLIKYFDIKNKQYLVKIIGNRDYLLKQNRKLPKNKVLVMCVECGQNFWAAKSIYQQSAFCYDCASVRCQKCSCVLSKNLIINGRRFGYPHNDTICEYCFQKSV